ncbi:MAG: restriction endonuclease [Methanomassiliicoccaceae archaeon]|nr:restriction endonuclease [Methanomassiliicoccaceae archaeon]
MEEKKIWGIHTQDDGLFLKGNVVAIGWKEMGDLSLIAPERESYKEKYSMVYPDAKKQSISVSANMLFRFVCEAQIGDYIVYPSKTNREIRIGTIGSNYIYCPNEPKYVHQRKVNWSNKQLPRTAFSQGALNEVGSFLTFFSIKNYGDEFLSALDKNFKAKEVADDEEEEIIKSAEEIIETTRDYIIKELSKRFKGHDFEEFVADLLNAMGYRTTISPRGGDHGVDIIAYKDELPPRILVQVKSQDSNITENAIQSLKGAMSEGDYGLFITLSNYAKNALNYLDRTPIIRGIDGVQLADLVMEYYDKLSEKNKRMIPLESVHIPIAENYKKQ